MAALAVLTKKREKRCKRFLGLTERFRRIVDPLVEIVDLDEKKRWIESRDKAYSEKGIISCRVNEIDPFDEYARMFVSRDYYKSNSSENFLCGVRVVNRDNPLGILPSELSFCNYDELQKIAFQIAGKGCDSNNLFKSDISDNDKMNLKKFLEKHNDSKAVYEIGGLFVANSNNGDSIDFLDLILGIGHIAYREGWSRVIQTINPKHMALYRNIPLYPYQKITGEYSDHCARPAITLGIDSEDFVPRYREIMGEK